MLADLRHAFRAIARMPVLTTVVVLSLGAGIAVNAVVFCWIQTVVFHPIAGVRDAAAFFVLETRNDSGLYPGSSWLEYRDLHERLRTMPDLAAARMAPFYVGEPGQTERGNGLLVSGNYFSSLGLTPAIGRFPTQDETRVGAAAAVAVISYEYWDARCHRDPDVLRRGLRLNGQPVGIVGVAPAGFRGTTLGLSFDLFVPAALAPALFSGSQELEDRSLRGYSVFGTLAPGVTPGAAQSDIDGVMRALATTYPQTNRTMVAELRSFWRSPRGPQMFLAAALGALQVIMLVLLLAVCGNTANLVLARASSRHREVSVRLALGSGPWRVARLLLTESLVLAFLGALLGVALASWGAAAFNALPPLRVHGIPIVFRAVLDPWTLVFAVGLAAGCGLVFGVAPAVQMARLDPQQALRIGGSTLRRSALRHVLMGAEVGLALFVLIVAALFLRSFMETRDADTGFRRDGLLLAEYDLAGHRTGEDTARAFAASILDTLRAVPSIQNAAIASSVPLDIHGLPSRSFFLTGRARADGAPDQALVNSVTQGYFDVMGIPFHSGRDFRPLTDTEGAPEAIVNDAFVERYLDRDEPLGRTLQLRGRVYSIVGVVKTSLYSAFGEPPTPIIYTAFRDRTPGAGTIHVRGRSGRESAVAADLRRVVRTLDPELPLFDVRSMNDHIEANLVLRRIPARLFTVIGPLLLLLAAIGIYAVVGYDVSLKRSEIGVKLALGASGPQVVLEIVLDSLKIVGAGAIVGWVGIFGAITNLLPQLRVDAEILGGVPLVLLGVATAACWLPARRAASVDPLIVLRQE